MKKTLAIANTLALIVTITINYLSNIGMVTGNTMKTISDRYSNYFTPAGYAFSIWGVIYLGLAGFIYYNWSTVNEKGNKVVSNVGWWFFVSCLANSAWVVAWLSNQLEVSVCIMLLLFTSLIIINRNIATGQHEYPHTKTLLLVKWPFAIYFGWVSVALIANVAALLTKLEWDGWGLPEVTWTLIMLCAAGAVNLLVIYTKRLYAFGIVGAWAVIAIAVANRAAGSTNSIIYTCYSVAAVVLAFIVINLLRRKSIAA